MTDAEKYGWKLVIWDKNTLKPVLQKEGTLDEINVVLDAHVMQSGHVLSLGPADSPLVYRDKEDGVESE